MKLFFSLLLICSFGSAALSCTCVYEKGMALNDYKKLLARTEAIFEAEVVAYGETVDFPLTIANNTFSEKKLEVKFKVSRVWKGHEKDEITAYADISSSCRLKPSIGMKGIFHLYKNADSDRLEMDYCSVGRDDELMKKVLGNGNEIQQKQEIKPAETGNEVSLLRRFFDLVSGIFV